MSKKKKDKNVNKIIRGIGNINLDDNLPWIDKYKLFISRALLLVL